MICRDRPEQWSATKACMQCMVTCFRRAPLVGSSHSWLSHSPHHLRPQHFPPRHSCRPAPLHRPRRQLRRHCCPKRHRLCVQLVHCRQDHLRQCRLHCQRFLHLCPRTLLQHRQTRRRRRHRRRQCRCPKTHHRRRRHHRLLLLQHRRRQHCLRCHPCGAPTRAPSRRSETCCARSGLMGGVMMVEQAPTISCATSVRTAQIADHACPTRLHRRHHCRRSSHRHRHRCPTHLLQRHHRHRRLLLRRHLPSLLRRRRRRFPCCHLSD